MLEEVILTRLEVTPKGELYAGFRGLNGIHFPNWKHLFTSRMLGRNTEEEYEQKERNKKYGRVKDRVNSIPSLKNCVTRLKDKYWWAYQLFCSIKKKKDLPVEEYVNNKGEVKKKPWFVMGGYTRQARWRLSAPGHCIKVDDYIVYGLKRQQQIKRQLDAARKRISETKSKGQLTRALNDLEALFDKYDGDNWPDIKKDLAQKSSLKSIDSEILLARREVADQIRITNQRLEGKLKLTFEQQHKGKRNHTLRLEQEDFSYLEKERNVDGKKIRNPDVRMPSGQELLDKRWMFFDIEIPHWRRKGQDKITWVGVTYVENGEKRKEIHTIHDVGEEEINGCMIHRYEDERSLVQGLTSRVNQEDPDFVSAYNAKFDLIKMRETDAGFPIGDEDSNPMFQVTTKFFERIGVRDRFVIDPMRWAKIARKYEINKKLETIAGFEKDISYDEMEELEDLVFRGGEEGKEAARKIASYLAVDVDRLVNIWETDRFQKNFIDACWLSDKFNLSLERIMHSTNCANDVQEKSYFSELGIYREEVPPHYRTTGMQKLKTTAKQKFTDLAIKPRIMQEEITGRVEDVHKVYVPMGDYFRDLLAVRFQDITDFFEHKDHFKKDKPRLLFLEQFGIEFSRWLREDYGFFIDEVRKFDKMLKGVNEERFEDAYHTLRRNIKVKSEPQFKRLNEAELGEEAIEKHTTLEFDAFLRREGFTDKETGKLDYKRAKEVVNQRSKVKRRGRNILGNYAISPTAKRFFKRKEGTLVIDEVLEERLNEVNDFITSNGLNIVAREGNYLYLKGDREVLEQEDSPVIFADNIPVLYNADQPYYKKFGFINHMKQKDEPDYHLNMFEMQIFGEMLHSLFEGENEKAKQIYTNALDKLRQGEVGTPKLVLYNKSKERYVAQNRRGKDSEKIEFVTREDLIKGEVQEDEHGRKYFVDETKDKKGKVIKSEAVYVMSLDEVELDIDKYEERFVSRGQGILAPVTGKKYDPNQLELLAIT